MIILLWIAGSLISFRMLRDNYLLRNGVFYNGDVIIMIAVSLCLSWVSIFFTGIENIILFVKKRK